MTNNEKPVSESEEPGNHFLETSPDAAAQDSAHENADSDEAQVSGSGAVAQDGGVAAGEGGVAVGGDVHGLVIVAGKDTRIIVTTPDEDVSEFRYPGLPLLPQPYYAHPYPLQANFTGRVSERQMLTEWIEYDQRPILVHAAIGGMGKSSLAWYWLQQDVDRSSLDGILWWSFYEGETSLSKLLDQAIVYVSGKTVDPADLPSNFDKVRMLIGLLQHRRILLVLDGFERQLRAYAGLSAAYQRDETAGRSVHARACVDPNAARFLRDLVAGVTQAKVLITTRLMVRDLEDRAGDPLAGCRKVELKGLDPGDAVAFMKAQGVTKGRPSEIIAACEAYGFHPLSLRLLSGLIARDKSAPGNITAAPRHGVHPDLVARQHHVLEAAYDALPGAIQQLLSRIAAFRGRTDFKTLKEVGGYADEVGLNNALDELVERGLLSFDATAGSFQIHPVVRAYAYERLDDKQETHILLRDYFQPLADEIGETYGIGSSDALAPVIELYHHMVSAGCFDEAQHLLYQKLYQPLFYQFNAYGLFAELIKGLFIDGETNPPMLSVRKRQSWCMNYLGSAYCHAGHLHQGAPIVQGAIDISREIGNWGQLAGQLQTMGYLIQFQLGRLKAAEEFLQESLRAVQQGRRVLNEASERRPLTDEEKEEFGRLVLNEGLGYRHLAIVLAHCGRFKEAEDLLHSSDSIFGPTEGEEYMSGRPAAWAILELLRGRPEEALRAAEETKEHSTPRISQRGVARSLRLRGASRLAKGQLDEAENYLYEALLESRRINRPELEVDALLDFAILRLQQAAQPGANRTRLTSESREYADEALAIANQCEYRVKQADIHAFLAQLELDVGDFGAARKHTQIARERAWCDGPPHSYRHALNQAEKLSKEIEQRLQ